jgi:hypothetical protein
LDFEPYSPYIWITQTAGGTLIDQRWQNTGEDVQEDLLSDLWFMKTVAEIVGDTDYQ